MKVGIEIQNFLSPKPVVLGLASRVFRYFVFPFFLISADPSFADECMGDGDFIELNSQADVDNFQVMYGGGGTCTSISKNLVVQGSDIANLHGLSDLVSVGEEFWITGNPILPNLEGLAGLEQIGRLNIQENDLLLNLIGLDSLSLIALAW